MNSINDYKINEQVVDFLLTSNAIEQEFSTSALYDSIKAWNFALTDHYYVSKRNRHRADSIQHPILEIHRILMHRLNPRIAGKVRDCAVTVGKRLCLFISTVMLEQQLTAWYEVHLRADTEEKIKTAHIAFEHLHPFEDGNGRVGRIIMNVQRVHARLPLLIIRPGKDQAEYYKWFQEG